MGHQRRHKAPQGTTKDQYETKKAVGIRKDTKGTLRTTNKEVSFVLRDTKWAVGTTKDHWKATRVSFYL